MVDGSQFSILDLYSFRKNQKLFVRHLRTLVHVRQRDVIGHITDGHGLIQLLLVEYVQEAIGELRQVHAVDWHC